MNIIPTPIQDVYLFEPNVFGDQRGYFFESFSEKFLSPINFTHKFVQDNEAMSTYGVIRGLHYQLPPFDQTKLVRVVSGEVLDVIVDIRPNSLTYGQVLTFRLNDVNKRQLLVPKGMAHGYAVLSDIAIFAYKCDNFYYPQAEGGIIYTDSNLNIEWIIPIEKQIVSNKDLVLPKFGSHKQFDTQI